MRRREFIAALGGAALAWPGPLAAQQPGKVYRVGILETTSPALNAANFEAFRKGLREAGYVEGQNLAFDYRSADGRDERFPELAADLVRLDVDLIVTRGTPAVLAAKNATTTIPVVMTGIADPLLAVASLNRPGGNVTGLTTLSSDLHAKRLELLREVVPSVTRIGLLTNLGNPATPPQWKEIEAVAQSLGVQPQLLDVRERDQIGSAFESAASSHLDGLVVSTDGFIQAHRILIADLAVKHGLPTIGGFTEFASAGGLMVYGPSYPDLYRRAAGYTVKILRGAKPADLPVEEPIQFELLLNLKTAKALGLTIPPTLLARAGQVIE